MSHFNFGNFLVDESNHNAFQVCQDVADLIPVSPLPVLIVGDEGCGKSHLLYSIVNRLRAGTAKTGLALVTANAFPDQVRNLISDPSPVANAKSAVLLIDQLEHFRDHLEELEGVVQIFLDHDHYVVGASSIHPARLRELPDGLRRTFESGTIAAIKPSQSTPAIELVRQQIRGEHQDELERAEKEIEELRMLLSEATGGEPSELTPADRAAAAEMTVLADQLRNALSEAEGAREAAEAGLVEAAAERDALMLRETEALAEAEAKHQADLSPLREHLKESETRLSELEVRTEVLTSEADEARAALEKGQQEQSELNDRINALKAELEDAAKPDEALMSEMESLRTLLAASEEARETERDRLDAEHADASATTQDELSQMRTDYARLEEDMEALRASKEDDVGRMRTEIDRLQSERAQMDDEVSRQAEEHARDTQSLHDQLAAQHEELEPMRAQAAEAEALRARADEVETLQSELDASRERQSQETSQLAEERESLAQELGEVRLDHDRLLQRLTETETSATSTAQERDDALAARDEAQAAREEALGRAEHVLDQVEANRVRMAEVAEHQRARITALEQRLSAVHSEESGAREAMADLEQRLVQTEHAAEERGQALEAMVGQTQSLEEALTRREVDVDLARKEASHAIEQLDRVQRQFDETQSAFELAQRRVRSLEGDLDALQAEAAAQVARANTQAGETESRLARILSAFETASAENHALRDELGEPNGSAENSVSRLMLLAERLAVSDPISVARAINPNSYDDNDDSDHSI